MAATPQLRSESPIGLRAIRASDREFLREVYAHTRLAELAPLGWSPQQVEAFIDMQFEAQQRDYWNNYDTARFHVVTSEGVDAGRLYVERRADELRVIDIALLPRFRDRGIASALFQCLFDEADAQGIAVRIHVEIENRARRLYLRLGFVFTGESGPVYRLMERLPHAPRVRSAA